MQRFLAVSEHAHLCLEKRAGSSAKSLRMSIVLPGADAGVQRDVRVSAHFSVARCKSPHAKAAGTPQRLTLTFSVKVLLQGELGACHHAHFLCRACCHGDTSCAT